MSTEQKSIQNRLKILSLKAIALIVIDHLCWKILTLFQRKKKVKIEMTISAHRLLPQTSIKELIE